MSNPNLTRRLAAEAVGTAMLVAAVVGSGIMAERLAGGNVAVALLANTIATSAALLALILTFAPASGAHFNPIVSVASAINGELAWSDAAFYIVLQIAGAIAGVAIANLMFDLPPFSVATKVRTGAGQWLGEIVAGAGLVGVVIAVSRQHRTPQSAAAAVAAFIGAGYWFTSSTSFANPAVTIARSLTDTFTGIQPADVPAFIGAQVAGCLAASYFSNWLVPVMKKRVLILCTGNSARSQMAEGILRNIAGDKFEVESAGVAPTSVRREAIDVMREIGIDISSHLSKSVDEFTSSPFDYVITVCDNAKETCPVFSADAARIHWSFDDPAAVEGTETERRAAFRRVRDEIRSRLVEFVK